MVMVNHSESSENRSLEMRENSEKQYCGNLHGQHVIASKINTEPFLINEVFHQRFP